MRERELLRAGSHYPPRKALDPSSLIVKSIQDHVSAGTPADLHYTTALSDIALRSYFVQQFQAHVPPSCGLSQSARQFRFHTHLHASRNFWGMLHVRLGSPLELLPRSLSITTHA